MLPPYFGYNGYNPAMGYPAAVAYPSEPAYSPEPIYTPEPSAAVQYAPLLNSYPSPDTLPAEAAAPLRAAIPQPRSETLLFLRDGSVFAVSTYAVSAGVLHYVTTYGAKNDIRVDDIDLHKTMEANAARGIAFTLSPAPNPAPVGAAPLPLGPAPAPDGPITPARH